MLSKLLFKQNFQPFGSTPLYSRLRPKTDFDDDEDGTVLCLDYALALIECLKQRVTDERGVDRQSYALDLLFWRRAQLTPGAFVDRLKNGLDRGLEPNGLPNCYQALGLLYSFGVFSEIEERRGLDFLLRSVPVREAHITFAFINELADIDMMAPLPAKSHTSSGPSSSSSAAVTRYLSNLLKDESVWAKEEGRPTLEHILGGDPAAYTRRCLLFFFEGSESDRTRIALDELKKQYRKLALKYHPDRSPPELKTINTRRFQVIQRVHHHLKRFT